MSFRRDQVQDASLAKSPLQLSYLSALYCSSSTHFTYCTSPYYLASWHTFALHQRILVDLDPGSTGSAAQEGEEEEGEEEGQVVLPHHTLLIQSSRRARVGDLASGREH